MECPAGAPEQDGICVKNCPPDSPYWDGDDCTDKCPYDKPVLDGNKCVPCFTQDRKKLLEDDYYCIPCYISDRSKFLLKDEKCVSCKEMYSKYSIKKVELCENETTYRNSYITSISLIAISFAGVSFIKLAAFCEGGGGNIDSVEC